MHLNLISKIVYVKSWEYRLRTEGEEKVKHVHINITVYVPGISYSEGRLTLCFQGFFFLMFISFHLLKKQSEKEKKKIYMENKKALLFADSLPECLQI